MQGNDKKDRMKDVIGYMAAFFTTFALFPQMIRIWKLKEARDISIFLPLMSSAGSALWLIYGIMIDKMPVIVANGVSLVFALAVFFITLKYR
jgi:MtN3 and saliva related transmembrane protein